MISTTIVLYSTRTFVIKVSMEGHFGLGLPLEEGVVQLLVVDVDLAQLGPNLLPHLRLQALVILLFLREEANLMSNLFSPIKIYNWHSLAERPSSLEFRSSWWTPADRRAAFRFLASLADISSWSTNVWAPEPCCECSSSAPTAWKHCVVLRPTS